MKNKFLQIGLIALIAIFAFMMTACEPEPEGEGEVQGTVNLTITNNTGYDVLLLQVVLSTEDNWGEDKLDSDEVLSDGKSKTIKVDKGTYDIRITDNDDPAFDTYSKRNVIINSNTTIVFTGAEIDRADAYGFLRIEHNAEGSGIYSVDILDDVGGASLKYLYWNSSSGFAYNTFYEFKKADQVTPEYNFKPGTYGLKIKQYTSQSGKYVTWEKKTTFTITKNKKTTVIFDQESDWKDANDYSHLHGRWVKDGTVGGTTTINITDGYFYIQYESDMGGGMPIDYEIISYEDKTMTLEDSGEPISFEIYINDKGKLIISGFGNDDGTYTFDDD